MVTLLDNLFGLYEKAVNILNNNILETILLKWRILHFAVSWSAERDRAGKRQAIRAAYQFHPIFIANKRLYLRLEFEPKNI